MAATTTTGLPLSASFRVAPTTAVRLRTSRPRRISPDAGHALEILGHAIEYLTDEFVHEGADLTAHNGQIDAVQLLMAVNRQIYYECPEVPTMSERFMALMRRFVESRP